MQRFVANVFGGMSQRIAIDHVAGLECTLCYLAIRCVVAVSASFQNVNHVRGVRVHLFFDPGRQSRFEHPDAIIFKPNFYRLRINDGWILRGHDRPDAG